jgi:hypothetical protein
VVVLVVTAVVVVLVATAGVVALVVRAGRVVDGAFPVVQAAATNATSRISATRMWFGVPMVFPFVGPERPPVMRALKVLRFSVTSFH